MVRQTPGAIGYVELAYAQGSDLSHAYLQNAAGSFVPPSTAGVTAAASGAALSISGESRGNILNAPGRDAYPISGFTYLLVYREQKDAAKAKALTDFLNWAIHEGQAFAEPLSYAALPSAVVKLDETALQSIQPTGGDPAK